MESTVFKAMACSPLFRKLQRAFCDATGLSLRLVRREAQPRRWVPDRHTRQFCALMRNSSLACAACLGVQREFQSRLAHKLNPQQVRCFAGLTELAVPVVVGGKHIATLMGGRVFQRKPQRRHFGRLARQLRAWGMGEEVRRIEGAFFDVPVVPPRQFQGAICLLTLLANQLAESAARLVLARTLGEPPPVARAKQLVLTHAGEGVTLKLAAEHVHLSRHYFCKLFKHSTGMTFTEFVARVRVERAKGLLGDPARRMTAVADDAGFQSISQFNRVFRRLVGTSPTRFRTALGS